jgi:FixJ family two-component response regulator
MDAHDLLGRHKRLLLAEDDDEVRWSLTALFLNGGYDVQAVKDGAQLLDEMASIILSRPGKEAPDVIVTDVRMPGFNAMNIIGGLRDAGWTTPVMVISAFGDAQLRARVQHFGEALFFDKPLDLDALETAVAAAALRKRGGRRAPSDGA